MTHQHRFYILSFVATPCCSITTAHVLQVERVCSHACHSADLQALPACPQHMPCSCWACCSLRGPAALRQ